MSVANAKVIEMELPEENWRDGGLQMRPGFLIRRLHQIHTALFNEACGELSLTPIMYSVLSALAKTGPIDQTSLSKAVAIDKTNMADVLERLRKQGFIRRRVSPKDRRVRLTDLTEKGQKMLDSADDRAKLAHLRTIEDLSPHEQDVLMGLMNKIIDAKS